MLIGPPNEEQCSVEKCEFCWRACRFSSKEWKKDGLPPNSEPYWKKGDGAGLEASMDEAHKHL